MLHRTNLKIWQPNQDFPHTAMGLVFESGTKLTRDREVIGMVIGYHDS
jgi:hypothetical protein